MEIKINVQKNHLYTLIALASLILGTIFVSAFNSGGPASFVGHSPEEGGVASGTVSFFNLSSCPLGWVEDVAARGKYIVGLPSGGTLEGGAGTALTNNENRPVGAHSHTVSDPSHGHGTSFSDPGHGHSASSSVTDPGHSHSVGAGGTLGGPVTFAASINDASPAGTFSTGSQTTGISVGTTVNSAFTGISIGVNNAGTGISVNSEGTTAGTNAPYLQYLVCVKV